MSSDPSLEPPSAEPGSPPAKRPALKALTGYRFFAAGSIVVLHSAHVPGGQGEAPAFLGFAVSFFYVLSGFILCYVYPRVEGRGARRSFWVARFARIWPLHAFTFALLLALVPIGRIIGHRYWPIFGPLNLALLQNWVPITSVALSFNGVAWSLSVEAFFYFLFPFLVARVSKNLAAILLGSLAARAALFAVSLFFALPLHANRHVDATALLTFNPLARLYEFVLGLVICQIWTAGSLARLPAWLLTMAELLGGGALIALGLGWNGLFAEATRRLGAVPALYLLPHLVPILFAFLIFVAADGRGLWSRLLALPPLVFLGEISFSIYMTHQVLFRALSHHGLFDLGSRILDFLAEGGLVLAVSTLTWRLVELPGRRFLNARWALRQPEAE